MHVNSFEDNLVESGRVGKSFWKYFNQNYPSNITLVKVLNYSKVNALHQFLKKTLKNNPV